MGYSTIIVAALLSINGTLHSKMVVCNELINCAKQSMSYTDFDRNDTLIPDATHSCESSINNGINTFQFSEF